jgi:hypothetical protein
LASYTLLVCDTLIAPSHALLTFLSFYGPVIAVRALFLTGVSHGGEEVPWLARKTVLIVQASNAGGNAGHAGNGSEKPIGTQGTLLNTLHFILVGVVAVTANINTICILLIEIGRYAGVALSLAAL